MRSLLYKFLGLPSAERWLLLKAALLLLGIKLGLWLLPFQTLRRFLDGLAQAPVKPREAKQFSAERIAWAVEVAGRRLPVARTCLTQALAAQVLLARRGHPALLHIGVTRAQEKEEFEAHAWLESRGEVVIGRYKLERYTPLVALEGEKP